MNKRMKTILLAVLIVFPCSVKAEYLGWLDFIALVIAIRAIERIVLEKDWGHCCKKQRAQGFFFIRSYEKQAHRRECLEGSSEMVLQLDNRERYMKKDF